MIHSNAHAVRMGCLPAAIPCGASFKATMAGWHRRFAPYCRKLRIFVAPWRCHALHRRRESTQMKIGWGLLLGLLIGTGCRLTGVPLPTPPLLVGALLVLAMMLGFLGTGWLLSMAG
jgi:XapX domain-containing protein